MSEDWLFRFYSEPISISELEVGWLSRSKQDVGLNSLEHSSVLS